MSESEDEGAFESADEIPEGSDDDQGGAKSKKLSKKVTKSIQDKDAAGDEKTKADSEVTVDSHAEASEDHQPDDGAKVEMKQQTETKEPETGEIPREIQSDSPPKTESVQKVEEKSEDEKKASTCMVWRWQYYSCIAVQCSSNNKKYW